MLHQSEKKRQVLGRHAPFVEGEDEIAAAGVDEEVRVLHTFRDALIGEQLPDVVIGEKRPKLLRHHIGVNGHVHPSCAQPIPKAVFGKVSVTSRRHARALYQTSTSLFVVVTKSCMSVTTPGLTMMMCFASREISPAPR